MGSRRWRDLLRQLFWIIVVLVIAVIFAPNAC